MINKLKRLNPSICFYDVRDDEFSKYGRILDGYDLEEIQKAASDIPYPAEGSAYVPSLEVFERLEISRRMQDEVFGTLPSQTGYCYGRNQVLGATEWHACSEFNVALTDLVLILGQRTDIEDGRLDSAKMKAFFIPRGTVVEIYATTLHFCPCQVHDEGFGCVVGLLRGTNVPLENKTMDKYLFRQNKWIICHESNEGLIGRGVVAGIYGENFNIKY